MEETRKEKHCKGSKPRPGLCCCCSKPLSFSLSGGTPWLRPFTLSAAQYGGTAIRKHAARRLVSENGLSGELSARRLALTEGLRGTAAGDRNHLFEEISSSAILSASNVNKLNKEVVSLLDSYNKRINTSINSIDNCDDNGLMAEAILPKYLNPLDPQGLPPHKLQYT